MWENFLRRVILRTALERLWDEYAKPTINTVLQALGVAFFAHPEAVLLSSLPDEQIDLFFASRPNLSRTHTDWPSLFAWVPREYGIWVLPNLIDLSRPSVSDYVFPQVLLMGNTTNQQPIPVVGEWWAGPGFITGTLELFNRHVHARLGWRPDDIDLYWQGFSFTIKILNNEN